MRPETGDLVSSGPTDVPVRPESRSLATMRLPHLRRLGCVALVSVFLTACSSGVETERSPAPITAASTSTSVQSSEATSQTPAPLPPPETTSTQASATQQPAEPTPVTTGSSTPPKITTTKTSAATPTPVGRDANGFALGGPPAPTGPANYDHPTHSDCLKHLDQVRAWSTYQNAHRPPGSTNYLPSSGDVQYLFVVCGLRY